VLAEFADRLEAADDKPATMQALIKEYYGHHRRVVFNGNGYAEDWVAEAARRGLPNIRATVDALAVLVQPATVELFETHQVLTRAELESRYHIYLEKYSKQINIEAGVMIDMVRRLVFPAGSAFAGSLAQTAGQLAAIGAVSAPQEKRAKRLAELLQDSVDEADRLERVLAEAQETAGELARAKLFLDKVVPQMAVLRARVDPLEKLVAKESWPLPTYEDLLFRL
jgi:glutamine synthetase